jgi:hypothetical protein
MTDIEKKAYKITLIRAASLSLMLIVGTWTFGGYVRDVVEGIANLKSSIDRLVKSNNEQIKKDSLTNVIVAQNTRDIDSLKKVKCCQMKTSSKLAHVIKYYTESHDSNGRLVLKAIYNN